MLGYPDRLPNDILPIVEEVMDETTPFFDIRGGYELFNRIEFTAELHQIRIENTVFNPRQIVFSQLKHSEMLAIFICTAGKGISHYVKNTMPADPLKGFIADILGSLVVEMATDRLMQTLSQNMTPRGLHITNRYSPGYCNWPTSEQHLLFALLPPENCGILLTESALMHPIKSVSGFAGIGANVRFQPYKCKLCDATNCGYRNRTQSFVSTI